MVPPFDDKAQLLIGNASVELQTGQSLLLGFRSVEPMDDQGESISNGGSIARLFVMGAIHYADARLQDRKFGFCRVYEAPKRIGGEGRFVPIDNLDYEYED